MDLAGSGSPVADCCENGNARSISSEREIS